MLFNSSAFLLFFTVFFPAYWLVHRHLRIRNALLVIGSYVFYGAWDWRFLSLIIISTLVDFYCGRKIHLTDKDSRRRFFLVLSLAVNLGILGFFKYFDFFVSSFADMLSAFGVETGRTTLDIILPVGISFYTFQTLSYTIDIYRRRLEPTHSLLDFAAFVAFFPQLVAGPIERARNLLPQIAGQVSVNAQMLRGAAALVLWGLYKKVLVADRLAVYVDTVFASPEAFSPAVCLVAAIFFGIQIYCDFSGYSDIARGIARALGIELMVNFNTPYFSTSLREFWHRWHISLSTWFRDYVFIPLGGSRGSQLQTARNVFITFVVSGFWHGANYTFLIWGALHGLGYMLDPFSRPMAEGRQPGLARRLAGLVIVGVFVQITWVFFRAENLGVALTMLGNIMMPWTWTPEAGGGATPGMSWAEFYLSLHLIGALFLVDLAVKDRGIDRLTELAQVPLRWAASWVLILAILLLAPEETGPFIYFQF